MAEYSPVARVRVRTSPLPVVAEKGWSEKWGAAHNAKRQESYKNDASYRETRLAQSRESYRKTKGVELFSCLDRIDTLEAYCAPRTVNFNGLLHADRLCFTMGEFAEIIGDHKAPVVYRWQSRGLIPEPIAKAQVWVITGGRGGSYWQEQAVYLLEEVKAMMSIIGAHQQVLRYYRTTDTETVRAVHSAVSTVRKTL